MKITPDTNLLVRAVVRDDEKQARAAIKVLKEAELIVLTLPLLCEFGWVLRRVYRFERQDIEIAIRALLEVESAVVNHAAVDAGLTFLQAGGDFADGIIAYEGRRLGGEVFVSFDKKAVKIITSHGQKAKLAI